MLHAAEAADHVRDGAAVGVVSEFVGIDMAAIHAYPDGVVSRLHCGLEGLVASRKIEIVHGEGTLRAPGAGEVDETVYRD